jgi:hypothetical protein
MSVGYFVCFMMVQEREYCAIKENQNKYIKVPFTRTYTLMSNCSIKDEL